MFFYVYIASNFVSVFYKTMVSILHNSDAVLWKEMDEEVLRMSTDEVVSRTRLLDNEIKVPTCHAFF